MPSDRPIRDKSIRDTLARVHKRTRNENRHEDFVADVEQIKPLLKQAGFAERQAWKIAVQKYPPLDGSPVEFFLNGPLKEFATEVLKMDIPEGPKQIQRRANSRWRAWLRLMHTIDLTRKANPMQVVQWVFDNAGVNPKKIDPTQVPSLGALRYLQHVQASEANYAEFLRGPWSKTIPDRRQIDWENKLVDDGRKQFALIDAFEASFEREEQQAEAEQSAA